MAQSLKSVRKMVPKLYAYPIGTGSCFPETKITNNDLIRIFKPKKPNGEPITDEWLQRNLGIKERRMDIDENGFWKGKWGTLNMAIASSLKAIQSAGIRPKDIAHVVYVTPTPSKSAAFQQDMQIFSRELDLAEDCTLVHHHLGCGALASAIKATADALQNLDPGRKTLVVDTTCVSATMFSPENTAIKYTARLKQLPWAWTTPALFADGSGALVFEGREDAGFVHLRNYHNPELNIMIKEKGGVETQIVTEHDITNDGYITIPETVRDHYVPTLLRMNDELNELAMNDLAPEGAEGVKYSHYFVHQANLTLVNKLSAELRQRDTFSGDFRIPTNVAEKGNTSGASTATLFDEEKRAGRLKEGTVARFLWIGAGNGAQYGGGTLVL